jgi:hypothetical protein
MSMPLPNSHAIAAGWNVPLLSLTAITTLFDTAGNVLPPPRALGSYSHGIPEPRGDMSVTVAGVASVKWIWDRIERSFRKIIRANYCGMGLNSLSGQVTIWTPIEEPGDYYRCNAMLYVPPIDSLQYDGETDWYNNFALSFVITEILDTP